MTTKLFFKWKKKKTGEKDAGLFVDDADAYEKYQREEEAEAVEQKVILFFLFRL